MNDSGTPPHDPAKHEAGQAAVAPRQSVRLATALAAAVFTVAAAGYAWTGSPGLMTGAPEKLPAPTILPTRSKSPLRYKDWHRSSRISPTMPKAGLCWRVPTFD